MAEQHMDLAARVNGSHAPGTESTPPRTVWH
jgi:hypothetical protein